MLGCLGASSRPCSSGALQSAPGTAKLTKAARLGSGAGSGRVPSMDYGVSMEYGVSGMVSTPPQLNVRRARGSRRHRRRSTAQLSSIATW